MAMISSHERVRLSTARHKAFLRSRAMRIFWALLRTAILLGVCFVMLYPVLFMVSNAFMNAADSYNPSVVWVPTSMSLQSFQLAVKYLEYGPALIRTLLIVLPSVVLQLLSTLMAGYGFARFRFKGRSVLFGLLIFTIIVPMQTYIIPQYVSMSSFDYFGLGKLVELFTGEPLTSNFTNTYFPFYLPALFGAGIRSGLYIFIVRQFFMGLPNELEDAAMIDGCGSFQTFLSIMLPNIVPAITTVAVFSIVWYYNDYLVSGMFLNHDLPLSPSLTMVKSIINMETQSTGLTGISVADLKLLVGPILCAGGLLVALPLSVMYIFAQKFFTESIGKTGLVG